VRKSVTGAPNLATYIFMFPLFGMGFPRIGKKTIHSRAASSRAISSSTIAFNVGTLS
jgi:hypothetical protein